MSYSYWADGGAYTDYRCFVWGTGANLLQRLAPAAGGTIDGVSYGHGYDPISGQHRGGGRIACPHIPVRVEASAAFSAGAQLETLADGRVKAVAGGTAVLKALEASSGAGAIVWAVFL
jgi:hypothetical protein